jgi:hypothetical protein
MDKPVVTTPDTFRESKLQAKTIERVRQKVAEKVKERSPHAKRKWEDVVTTEEGRFAAACKECETHVTITKVRRVQTKGKIPQTRG